MNFELTEAQRQIVRQMPTLCANSHDEHRRERVLAGIPHA
jgi:hypothetical protein